MTKGLKELKRLPNAIKDTFKDSFDIIKKELKENEKNKKALKIMKNKQVSIRALEQCIKNNCLYPSLTKEEQNLLKEALSYEK